MEHLKVDQKVLIVVPVLKLQNSVSNVSTSSLNSVTITLLESRQDRFGQTPPTYLPIYDHLVN